MLKIRLSRVGKRTQPSYKVVVQEHTSPIKGKFVEDLGFYKPTSNPKEFKVDMERVTHWISVGAAPSDTVASLLKRNGAEGMDKFIDPKNKQAKKKKAVEEKPAAAPAAPAAEAPAVEEAPAPVEAAEAPAAEEAPVEEPKEEAPKEEAPAAEEAPAEEPKEEAPKEEAPAEEAEAPAEEEKSE